VTFQQTPADSIFQAYNHPAANDSGSSDVDDLADLTFTMTNVECKTKPKKKVQTKKKLQSKKEVNKFFSYTYILLLSLTL
jgi:hypothetical protein